MQSRAAAQTLVRILFMVNLLARPLGDAEAAAATAWAPPRLGAAPQGPTTRITKVPGSMAGRGWGTSAVGAGGGPKSAVTR